MCFLPQYKKYIFHTLIKFITQHYTEVHHFCPSHCGPRPIFFPSSLHSLAEKTKQQLTPPVQKVQLFQLPEKNGDRLHRTCFTKFFLTRSTHTAEVLHYFGMCSGGEPYTQVLCVFVVRNVENQNFMFGNDTHKLFSLFYIHLYLKYIIKMVA